MKLYSSPGSPNALRSRAVAYELGLDPEIVNVNIGAGENRAPDYLKLNPNGKVPVLVDDDVVLWESRAINSYLAAQAPEHGLDSPDPLRHALIEQWSNWQAIHLGPAMQRIAFERVQKTAFGRGEPDEASITGEVKTAGELLGVLDAALVGKQWVLESPTLADFALGTTFMLRKSARLGVEAFSNVTAWIERLEARPSWQKAIGPWKELMASRGIPAN